MISIIRDNTCELKIADYKITTELSSGENYLVISLLDAFISLYKNECGIAKIGCFYEPTHHLVLTGFAHYHIIENHGYCEVISWDGWVPEMIKNFCDDIRSRKIQEWIPTNFARKAGVYREFCESKLKELESLWLENERIDDYEVSGHFVDDDGNYFDNSTDYELYGVC